MLHSELDPAPLLDDVRATCGAGPDGGELVIVEGVWSAAASGAPPPVLFVDDGARRHTLAALPSPPPDDPSAFRATFAVPHELVDRLRAGLALGLGRTEVPLTLSASGPVSVPWLEGAPVITRPVADERAVGGAEAVAGEQAEPEAADERPDPAAPPGRRFQRRAHRMASDASQEGIAAAILRVTTPPVPESATVVERSVIAERRARRSEQLAAVMERRARGAEDTAQELSASVRSLEARLAEVTAERDRLAAELEALRGTSAQARRGREAAEARLAELLAGRDAGGATAAEARAQLPPDEAGARGPARALPGLQEAARALRDQEAPQPVAPAEGPDPFADALAKLRARTDLAAVVSARVVSEPATSASPSAGPGRVASAAPDPAPLAVPDAAPLPEQVIPFVIAAEHPRIPWLARAIAQLDERDRIAAANLVVSLLPDQGRTARRPLVYDLELQGFGALRVELERRGAGRVSRRDGPSPDASFVLEATPAELAPLAAGGAPLFPRGLRVGGARSFFLPLTRLSRARRRPLSLADALDAGIALDAALVVRALASAVPADWTAGHAFAVTLSVSGTETCRVRVADGSPLDVVRVDETGRRTVVASTATARARVHREGAIGGADAVLLAPERGALPLLGQAEPPDDVAPATVLGDLAAATTLLSWFDRVQGLRPRA